MAAENALSLNLPTVATVRRNFEGIADRLGQHDQLYQEVRGRLLERLEPVVIAPTVILDLGCGTGGTSGLLRQKYPDSQVIGLDLAAQLVRQAGRGRWWRRNPVCQGDFHQLPLASESIDLVVANLSLHWAEQLPQVVAEARRVLRSDGLVLFSCFGPETLRELREAWYRADPDYVHVMAFPDMHDLGDAFVQAGFAGPVLDAEYFCLTYSGQQQLTDELRGLGMSNACVGRRKGLTGKQRWQQMSEVYARQKSEGRLPATFEVVYGHAWVGQPRGEQRDSITVPFITPASRTTTESG